MILGFFNATTKVSTPSNGRSQIVASKVFHLPRSSRTPMFDSKSAINFTSTFMIPTFTALSLFSFNVHSEYIVVNTSFFARNPPLSRRPTNGRIASDRPIAALFSSTCDSRNSVHVAFSFIVLVPVFIARTNALFLIFE